MASVHIKTEINDPSNHSVIKKEAVDDTSLFDELMDEEFTNEVLDQLKEVPANSDENLNIQSIVAEGDLLPEKECALFSRRVRKNKDISAHEQDVPELNGNSEEIHIAKGTEIRKASKRSRSPQTSRDDHKPEKRATNENSNSVQLPLPKKEEIDHYSNNLSNGNECILPLPFLAKEDIDGVMQLPRPMKEDLILPRPFNIITVKNESVKECNNSSEEIPSPPKFQLDDENLTIGHNEIIQQTRRSPSPDIGFKKITLIKPRREVVQRNKKEPVCQLPKIQDTKDDFVKIRSAIDKLRALKHSSSNSFLYTSKIYIPEKLYDGDFNNKSMLSSFKSPTYKISSTKHVDFSYYGFTEIPPKLKSACHELGIDAHKIFKKIYSLDEEEQELLPVDISRINGAIPTSNKFAVGTQTEPTFSTKIGFDVDVHTQTEENSELIRIIGTLNQNQMLALYDFANIVQSGGAEFGESYKIRDRLWEIFSLSLRPYAVDAHYSIEHHTPQASRFIRNAINDGQPGFFNAHSSHMRGTPKYGRGAKRNTNN